MKTFRIFVVFTALLFAGVAVPAPARADAEVSFDFFYESLAPYGEWINVGDYGLCWRPTDVDPDWTPYSDGYWAFTDAGWTWVSYEDFGGIVYHYGRWIRLDDDDGWCWTPDYEWGPAWVSWRSNDDYVGWAPLPPEAHWQRDVGIGIWVDRTCDIGPGYYNFCHTRDFGAPVLRGVIINRGQNVTIIRNTVNITNITYNTGYFAGPVIYNGGPSFERINRFSARPVPALRLVQNTKFDSAHWRDHRGPGGRLAFNAQTVGNQLLVPAPRVTPPSDPLALRSQAKRTIAGDKVGKGWGMVKNPEVQKELRQEIHRQSKGFTPETAPARAVAATDLKAVPTKADPKATPAATGTIDRHERSGRGQRPEGVAVQPNPAAPATPIAGNPNLKPFNRDPRQNPPGQVPKSQDPATATFTPTPRGPDGNGTTGTGRNRPRTVDANPQQLRQPQQPQQPDRTAEQGRMRGEQERAAQQKQAEMATQQQKQAEAAAQQQKQAEAAAQQRKQAEMATQQQRQAEMATQQRKQAEITAQQQKQAEMAAQQRKQAERDSQQQKQAEAAAQQQKQAESAMRQKQVAAQQEAAKAQAEEYRRRQGAEQQRQQQQIQQQQQQQRGVDPRRAQQDGDRERARQQSESQRNAQVQQQQQRQQQQQQRQQPPPQQQRQQQPPQQPQRQQQAQPQQQPSRSEGRDKDKDKKGN